MVVKIRHDEILIITIKSFPLILKFIIEITCQFLLTFRAEVVAAIFNKGKPQFCEYLAVLLRVIIVYSIDSIEL